MKKIIIALAVVYLAGCGQQSKSVMIRHSVTIPCTNQYALVNQTRITTDLDLRRSPSSPLRPNALLEYSIDGKLFAPFSMVSYNTFSDSQGIREITIGDTNVWIRITTTNQTDVGRSVVLTFMETVR